MGRARPSCQGDIIFLYFVKGIVLTKASSIDKLTQEFHNKNDNFEVVSHVSGVHCSSSVKKS